MFLKGNFLMIILRVGTTAKQSFSCFFHRPMYSRISVVKYEPRGFRNRNSHIFSNTLCLKKYLNFGYETPEVRILRPFRRGRSVSSASFKFSSWNPIHLRSTLSWPISAVFLVYLIIEFFVLKPQHRLKRTGRSCRSF